MDEAQSHHLANSIVYSDMTAFTISKRGGNNGD
jgi:hypothetical protein